MEGFMECKYKEYGCVAILDPEEAAEHYKCEAESHLNFLMLKLKMEAQRCTVHQKAHQKALLGMRKLKDENQKLQSDNLRYQQKIRDLEAQNAKLKCTMNQESKHVASKASVQVPSLVSMLYGPGFASTNTNTSAPLIVNKQTQTDHSLDDLEETLPLDLATMPETDSSTSTSEPLPYPVHDITVTKPFNFTSTGILDPVRPLWKPAIPHTAIAVPVAPAPALAPTLPAMIRALADDPLIARTDDDLLNELAQLRKEQLRAFQLRDKTGINDYLTQILKREFKTKGQLALRRQIREYSNAADLVDQLPRLPPDARLVCDSPMGKEMLPDTIRTKIKDITTPQAPDTSKWPFHGSGAPEREGRCPVKALKAFLANRSK